MLVSRLAVGQAQFHQRPVPVGLVTVIIAGHTPSHRGKGPNLTAYLIVGIDAGLQGVQALRLVVVVL